MRGLRGLLVLLLTIPVYGKAPADFSGRWQQQTSSGAQRQMEIEQTDQNLRVKTTVTTSEGRRQLEVKYEIGGPETTYIGLDGDEFRSSVGWDGSSLVFQTTEHEAGSEVPQKAVWTLSADGNTLQVDRESTKLGKATRSSTSWLRQP